MKLGKNFIKPNCAKQKISKDRRSKKEFQQICLNPLVLMVIPPELEPGVMDYILREMNDPD